MMPPRPVVLVTRARSQQEPLVVALHQAGYDAARLAAIEITHLPSSIQLVAEPPVDTVMAFTSANAVHAAADNGLLDWLLCVPRSNTLLAIGPATARALETRTAQQVVTVPHPHTSEALLQMALWQNTQPRKVELIKGVGGRGLIGAALQQRGFKVREHDVYQRDLPAIDTERVSGQLLHPALAATTVTSNEVLKHLLQIAAACGNREQQRLQGLPLVVCSDRAHALALELGFHNKIQIADNASVDAIVDAVNQVFNR